MTLAEINAEVLRFDIKPEDGEYLPAAILFAALEVGTNADVIAALIGRPRAAVRAIAKRLREQGVWKGQKTVCSWFEEHGGIAFLMDVNVALGFMVRTKGVA